jgi:hypothetical protein
MMLLYGILISGMRLLLISPASRSKERRLFVISVLEHPSHGALTITNSKSTTSAGFVPMIDAPNIGVVKIGLISRAMPCGKS